VDCGLNPIAVKLSGGVKDLVIILRSCQAVFHERVRRPDINGAIEQLRSFRGGERLAAPRAVPSACMGVRSPIEAFGIKNDQMSLFFDFINEKKMYFCISIKNN
jgi:hypothetical protein